MPFHHVSRDVKLAAIRLYDRDLLQIEDIFDCVCFSQRTFMIWPYPCTLGQDRRHCQAQIWHWRLPSCSPNWQCGLPPSTDSPAPRLVSQWASVPASNQPFHCRSLYHYLLDTFTCRCLLEETQEGRIWAQWRGTECFHQSYGNVWPQRAGFFGRNIEKREDCCPDIWPFEEEQAGCYEATLYPWTPSHSDCSANCRRNCRVQSGRGVDDQRSLSQVSWARCGVFTFSFLYNVPSYIPWHSFHYALRIPVHWVSL